MAQSFKTGITVDDAAAASSQAIATNVNADTHNRLTIDAGGKITWGSGSGTGDTTLYRSAANTLKTDDDFTAASLAVTGAFTLPTSDGSADQILVTDGSGTVTWANNTASATGAGSDGQLQYNNGGATAGAGGLYYDDSNARLGIGTSSPDDALHVVGDTTIEVSDEGSAAQPEFTLHRESSTPQDGDYLGQLKFSGKNDAGQTVNYAKMTAKISDATDTTEDGLFEFAFQKAGSLNIGGRFTSTDLKLINGTGLQVDGNVGIGNTSPSTELDVTGNVTATGFSGPLTGNASTATSLATARNINGESFDGTSDITVTAAAGTLTGNTLASGVTASSLTSVGTLTTLTVAGDATFDTSTLHVDATNNRVGIGNTTPAQALDVSGTVTANALAVNGAFTLPTSDGTADQILVTDGAGGVSWSDNSATVSPAGSDGQIQYNNGGALGGASQLYFNDSTARLGVGTSSPGAEIEIANDSPTLRCTDTDTDLTDNEIAAAIEFYGSDSDDTGLAAYIHADADGTAGAMQLRFGTGTAGATADRMTIQADGNVGIGTTSPGEPLHIVTASGDAYLKQENGTATTFLGPDSSNTGLFGTSSNHDVRFITNNSERLRIDTSGDASMAGHLTAQSGGADGGLVLGQAFSADYVGLRTAGMSETSGGEYVLISDGGTTLLSGGTGSDVYVRAGGNSSTHQIQLDTSEGVTNFAGAANFDSGTLYVDDSANEVGIGTTTPGAKLHVNAGTVNNVASFESTDAGAIISLRDNSTTGNSYVGIRADGDQLSLRAGNGNRVSLTSSVMTSTVPLRAPNGSAAAPALSFTNDSNTGFFITGNGGVTRWSGNGTEGGYVYSGGIRTVDGSAAAPAYSFTGDSNTGMYRNTTDQLSLTAGGTQSLIAAGGTVNTAGLSTSTTSGYRYVMRNSTFGTLYHYTSSVDVKENITNVTSADAGAWIDALQPVTFNEKWLQDGVESEEDRAFREADVQVGFIADDVLADPTTAQFAQVEDVDGTLKGVGWKWECVIAAAVAEIKSLRARVAELESA